MDHLTEPDRPEASQQDALHTSTPAPVGSAEDRRDLRRYASQTNLRLALGMAILLLTVGNGLVFWIYGPGALLTSLSCILSFALPVVLIAILLWALSWISKRARDE